LLARWSRRFAAAEQAGSASIIVDGVFVDYPIVYKAERIVAQAEAIAAPDAASHRPPGASEDECNVA